MSPGCLRDEQHQRLPCGERQDREPEERHRDDTARTPGGGAAAAVRVAIARWTRPPLVRGVARSATPSPATATRARGTSATRAPASRARTPRSRPSSAPARAGSSPAELAPRLSLRTRMPRTSAPSTSSRTSCWPWSSSPSASPTARPSRVTLTPERDDRGAVVPAHELGGDEGDRGRELERAGEVGERIRLRRRVLGEQPDRVAVDAPSGDRGGLREPGARGRRDDRFGRGRDAATSATTGSSPQTTMVRASTGRDCAATAASVRRRWNAAGARPSGRTTRIAWTRPGMTSSA